MSAREFGYVTVAPRTFSFCPVISVDAFTSGFAACDRIVSGIYQPASSGGAPSSIGGFLPNSVSYNYTLRAAANASCGKSYEAYSGSAQDGLSCVQQVRLAPFVQPGGDDDSFFTCTAEAMRRQDWLNSGNAATVIVACVLVGIFFLIPVAYNIWLLAVRHAAARRKDGVVASGGGKGGKGSKGSKGGGDGGGGGAAGRVYLSFEDVHYSVVLNSSARKKALADAKAAGVAKADLPPYWDRKRLLTGVSGCFAPGSLTAIMGPSGCGKSTLLKILSDRHRAGDADGTILLNGAPRGPSFKRACGFVEQSDALFASLTVREMLMFTAELRCEGGGLADKAARVDAVLADLDLRRVANSRIGGGGRRGISGGQQRRVTVGVELVTSPSVLFLDEPTTGLDAFSSLLLVRSLRTLADSGRTVLCTIHQPRPDIFDLFSSVLLMSAGEVAYFGPRGGIAPFLASCGRPIPAGENPADFVVDLTSNPDEKAFVHRLVAAFPRSDAGVAMAATVRALGDGSFPAIARGEVRPVEEAFGATAGGGGGGGGGGASSSSSSSSSSFAQGLVGQTYILSRRAYTNSLRSPDFFRRIFLVPLLQYLFFGVLYVGTRSNEALLRSRAAGSGAALTASDASLEAFMHLISQKRSFYFQLMSAAILTENSVMAEAFDEQAAFRREHAAGAYSLGAYHVQWALRLNFRAIYKSVLFGSVVYFLPAHADNTFGAADMGADLGQTFLFFLMVMCVCSTLGSALALLFISLIPDAEGAAGAHNAISAVLLQYSGYYLLPCLMPFPINVPYFLSFGKYALEALLRNEFGTVPYGTQWNLFNSVQQSIDPTISRWGNILILMLYPFAFHLLALLSSWLQTRPKSFWMPLEDFLHRHAPRRFPAREELARARATAAGKAIQMVEVASAAADAEHV